MASHDSSSVDPPATIPEVAASGVVEKPSSTTATTTAAAAAAITTATTTSGGAQHVTETVQHEPGGFHHDDEYLNGLDVDSNETDTDSAITDLRNASSTASVRSSVFQFVEDNGRTYHSYKQGKYFLPNDDTEQERLDLQHHLWLLMLKNKLYVCPVSSPQRVLDLGTGTGIWAIEFGIPSSVIRAKNGALILLIATQNPSADVIGTDLSPIQPPFVPPNCRFEVDDAEDLWTYNHKFDFIHGRLLFSAFENPAKVIQSAYDALAPGGYLEMQEAYCGVHSIDGTVHGTAIERWSLAIFDGAKALGRDWRCAGKYKQWFLDAGFEDVVEDRFPAPVGTWPRDKDDKLVGLYWTANMLDGINAMSNVTLRKGLGMSSEDMELLLVDVRRDLKNRSIHPYFPMYVVHGRKPLSA